MNRQVARYPTVPSIRADLIALGYDPARFRISQDEQGEVLVAFTGPGADLGVAAHLLRTAGCWTVTAARGRLAVTAWTGP